MANMLIFSKILGPEANDEDVYENFHIRVYL